MESKLDRTVQMMEKILDRGVRLRSTESVAEHRTRRNDSANFDLASVPPRKVPNQPPAESLFRPSVGAAKTGRTLSMEIPQTPKPVPPPHPPIPAIPSLGDSSSDLEPYSLENANEVITIDFDSEETIQPEFKEREHNTLSGEMSMDTASNDSTVTSPIAGNRRKLSDVNEMDSSKRRFQQNKQLEQRTRAQFFLRPAMLSKCLSRRRVQSAEKASFRRMGRGEEAIHTKGGEKVQI